MGSSLHLLSQARVAQVKFETDLEFLAQCLGFKILGLRIFAGGLTGGSRI